MGVPGGGGRQDVPTLLAIYNHYILHSTSTFEIEPLSLATMAERVVAKQRHHNWLVAEAQGQVVGYSYYGTFNSRAAYNHTVDLSVYVAPEQVGQGWGQRLGAGAIAAAQAQGFREMVSLITRPNPPSLALHRRLGFHPVGHLTQVGYKFDQYLDVAIWQRSLG